MAQILKKEKEESILTTSRSLFINNGYNATSMKDIASNTNISVGNLYRYYKSKTDIAFTIVKPLFEEIDIFIKKYTSNSISIFSLEFKFDKNDIINPKEIEKIVKELIKYLTGLYKKYPEEFLIVNSCKEIIDYLKKWLSSLIRYFIEKKYKILNIFSDEVIALVTSYTNAIIEGAINIYTDNNLNSKKKEKVLSIYFNSYLSMLDISKIGIKE